MKNNKMEQIKGTIGNSQTDRLQSNNQNGLIIGIGSGIAIYDYMYPLLKEMGFAYCVMDIDAHYLDLSRSPECDKLYLNGKNEEEKIFSEEVDMQTFDLPTVHLIKDKIKETNSEVVYIMVYLGYEWTDLLVFETAKAAKELGKIVVTIIAMPAKWEKIDDSIQAKNAISRMKPYVDTSFVFYRDTFEEDNPDIYEEFSPLELATHTFKLPFTVINHIINQKGFIIVDECDVKKIFKSGTFSAVGVGQSKQSNRVSEMFTQILGSPFLEYLNREKCNLILLSFASSENNEILMDEIEHFNQLIKQHFGEETEIIVGMKYDNKLGEFAKIVCMFSFSEDAIYF